MITWKYWVAVVMFEILVGIRVGVDILIYKLRGGKVEESFKEVWDMIMEEAAGRAHNFAHFTGVHMTIKRKGWKWEAAAISHSDYIKMTQKKMNLWSRTLPLEEFIRRSLEEAYNGCTFICFIVRKERLKFVQFWTQDQKLYFDFIANRTNKLGVYYPKVKALLQREGFKRGSKTEPGCYELTITKEEKLVDADFGSDVNRAAKVTAKIFRNIYKTERVRAWVQ